MQVHRPGIVDNAREISIVAARIIMRHA